MGAIKVKGNIPQYAKPGDAGADLIASEAHTIMPGSRVLVPTGTWLELPENYVGLIHPRSGLAANHGVTIINTPGTIDSGYRGEIKVALINHGNRPFEVEAGSRIAQLVIQEFVSAQFVPADDLSESDRGDNGFGSTGI